MSGIGITGTQLGGSEFQLKALRFLLIRCLEFDSEAELHHGDCIGFDEQAHELALEVGLRVVVHPPLDSGKRAWCQGYTKCLEPKPYLERNRDIVDATGFLIAGPLSERRNPRSGTWYTIKYARKKHGRVIVLPRN